MKIQTNSKILSSLILPTGVTQLTLNQKFRNGIINCFRCGLTGYYKGGGTKSLNSSSDYSSNSIVIDVNGQVYKNGVLDGGEYAYIQVTGFDSGSCRGICEVIS